MGNARNRRKKKPQQAILELDPVGTEARPVAAPAIITPTAEEQQRHNQVNNQVENFPVETLEELTDFWYSKNAANLFCPQGGETAYEAAVAQKELLLCAANDDNALRELIDGLGIDAELPLHESTGVPITLPLSGVQKLLKHKKILALFMAQALDIALKYDKHSGQSFHWQAICGEAVKTMNGIGLMTYTSATGKAIRDWFVIFRQRRMFPNPLLEAHGYGPPFLLAHPETVVRLKEKGNSNLEALTCDLIHDWFHHKELPRILKESNSRLPEGQSLFAEDGADYLAQYFCKRVCRATIHNWMLYCGFE